MPNPQPIYRPDGLTPAYHLHYTWTGWMDAGFDQASSDTEMWDVLKCRWESDSLRLLERTASGDMIQLCFSCPPQVTPVLVAQRAKGRLQHALRTTGKPADFSRKVSVRSVGENTTETVEWYIANQVERAPHLDARFRAELERLIVIDDTVDLTVPTASLSGRYWYNLHMVLVGAERATMGSLATLQMLRDTTLRIGQQKGYRIAALSVMPDHLHVALRGAVEQSPQDIALAMMNNLSYVVGQKAIWRNGYYVGTFSEYDMGAIRQRVKAS